MPEQIQSNPFNRPPRVQESFSPIEIEIPAPPSPPEDNARNLLLQILPMAGFLVMGLFYSLAFMGQGNGFGVFYALPMVAMGIFTFISSFVIYGEQKYEQEQRRIKQMREYHRLLDKKESRLLAGRELQSKLWWKRFPSPENLLSRVRNLEINLWERRPEDPDFLVFRIGVGKVPSAIGIHPPDPDMNNQDIRRAFGLYTEYKWIPSTPVTINMKDIGSLALIGRRNQTLGLIRSMLTQMAALNSPDDVRIFLFSSAENYRSWESLRWLPHVRETQAGESQVMMAFERESSREMITTISKILDARRQATANEEGTPVVNGPTLLILFDNETDIRDEPTFSLLIREGLTLDALSIFLCATSEDAPSDCGGIIRLADDFSFDYSEVGMGGIQLEGVADHVSLVKLDNLTHKLLPISLKSLGQQSRIPTRINLLQVYQTIKIKDLDIPGRWNRLPREDGLLPFVVDVGAETYANPLAIDLAENKDGPHGIIAGTTGSGKSQLLQTLVAALALEHHPYYLNFMLIDFKGGSTFGIFKNLPHLVGMVSNLDKSSALRALEAIKAENLRRQKFLRDMNVESIGEYHSRLNGETGLPKTWIPLPHLFIVVDEFAQLAHDMPNFLPQLVETVRVGRSLGLHLVLATQRPGGVVSDEMRANLNFRISLRVQTIEDSRDMLRRPDAAMLPHDLPGRAYFQLGDGGTPRQFQTAQVGVDYEEESEDTFESSSYLYRLFYERPIKLLEPVKKDLKLKLGEPSLKQKERITIAKQLVQDMKDFYSERISMDGLMVMDPILLPPLPEKIPIREIVMREKSIWRADTQTWDGSLLGEGLRIPVGRTDCLSDRTQPAYWIDFQKFGGHVIVVGAPKSGKSNFLKSVIYGLSMRYRPDEVHIYALSFAGKDLEALIRLPDEGGNTVTQEPSECEDNNCNGIPHIGDVIFGSEEERFHRLLQLLQRELETRKQHFGKVQAQDLDSYNNKVGPDNRLPYVVILIDNFGELKNPDFDDELTEITKLIQNGRSYGLHFLLTALQSDDIPYKIANLIPQRMALNLTDHNDYLLLVGRPESLEFDDLPPGHCFIVGNPPLQCQLGEAPELDSWRDEIRMMNLAWDSKPRPMPIGILPPRVYLSRLFELYDSTIQWLPSKETKLLAGIDGSTLRTAVMDLAIDGPHLLVGGPSRSGKTSLLTALVLSLARQYSPEDLWVVLMDGTGGSLRPLANLPHVIEWVTEEDGLSRNIACLQNEIVVRRAEVISHPKDHGFPRILFVIDDYDLTIEALALNDIILSKLGRHIRQDSGLDFHFILSASSQSLGSGGDPLIKALRLARAGISLGDVETLDILGGHLTPAMRREELREGRGYMVNRFGVRLTQFAEPDQAAFQIVQDMWNGYPRAKWPNPASEDQVDQVMADSAPAQHAGEVDVKQTPWSSGSLIDKEKSVQEYLRQQAARKNL